MTAGGPAHLPLDELRALWDAEGPEAAIAAVCERVAVHGATTAAELILGRMLLEVGRADEAAEHLLAAARDEALRPQALLSLASCAPVPMLPETLALFTSLPDPVEEQHELRYAYGLALWRYGDRAEAIRVWSSLPAAARQAAREPLDGAILAYASGLLKERRLGESLATLDGLADPTGPLACATRRAIAFAALAAQETGLARKAAEGLRQSTRPVDRALCAFALPRGEDRAAGLAAVARDCQDKEIAGWAQVTAAAEWASQGDYDAALSCLPDAAVGKEGEVLRALLRVAAGCPPGEAAGNEVDWALLREVSREVPGLVAALAPEAAPAGPLREAAYWLARADHERAYRLLTEAQRATPWDPRFARSLALLAYVRATRAAPEVHAEAWCDCFAQLAPIIENPRRLHAWILDRLAAYGVRGNERELGEALKEELRRFINGRLSELLAAALHRGDEAAAAQVRGLQAAFARECRAAEAMLRAGGFRSPDGEPMALGPLLAERTGQLDALRSYFAEQAPESGELVSDRLKELLERIGVREAGAEAAMAAAGSQPVAELRRWFSELGEAASYAAAGDARQARNLALDVFVRWSPPEQPDSAEFSRANPAYAAMPDGVGRLCRDAASMVCEMNVEVFSRLLADRDLDAQAVGKEIRRVLVEGQALGFDMPVQRRLIRLIRGKRTSLIEEGATPTLRQACLLLRHAAKAGIDGLEADRTRALTEYAARLYQQKRWRQAAEACEEAWKLGPTIQAVPMCHVASLLQRYNRLEKSGRHAEAREAVTRAREVAREAAAAFPAIDQVRNLTSAVRMIEHGRPVGDILRMPTPKSEKPPSLRSMPPEALAALRECYAARKEDRLGEALEAAERAWQAAPNHPDAAILVAQTALDLARGIRQAHAALHSTSSCPEPVEGSESMGGGAPERGRELFAQAEACLGPMLKRFPAHQRLQMVASVLERDRALYHGEDALAFLHRKGILLLLGERFAEAAGVLKVVFALAARQDPEVISLLAAALVEQVAADGTRRSREAGETLDTAGKLLTIGAELAPGHYAMAQTREKLSALRAELD